MKESYHRVLDLWYDVLSRSIVVAVAVAIAVVIVLPPFV